MAKKPPPKGGFIHRSANYGLVAEVARCGVRRSDGFSIHPAKKLTTCLDCLKVPNTNWKVLHRPIEAIRPHFRKGS